MGVSINVNTSPLAGKDGTKVALNDLKTRVKEEAENDVALSVDLGGKTSTSIMIKGRGDLYYFSHIFQAYWSLIGETKKRRL